MSSPVATRRVEEHEDEVAPVFSTGLSSPFRVSCPWLDADWRVAVASTPLTVTALVESAAPGQFIFWLYCFP